MKSDKMFQRSPLVTLPIYLFTLPLRSFFSKKERKKVSLKLMKTLSMFQFNYITFIHEKCKLINKLPFSSGTMKVMEWNPTPHLPFLIHYLFLSLCLNVFLFLLRLTRHSFYLSLLFGSSRLESFLSLSLGSMVSKAPWGD